MAQRRMFSKRITNTDLFLEMPLSAQALYFHLNMEADDDGFIDKAKTIRRTIGASEDDLKILIAKQFVLPFDSGVMVIKHWRIHNLIRKDTYQPTFYQTEKLMIESEMPSYQKKLPKNVDDTLTGSQQAVDNPLTQDRLGEDRLGEESIDIDDKKLSVYQEIVDYLNELTNSSFKATNKNTQKLINARLKEGYTVDDLKLVCKDKTDEWLYKIGVPSWQKNENMERYLRPSTLFKVSKFEEYLEKARKNQKNQIAESDERLGF